MIKGKGFRGALRYNMEKVGKNVAEVLDHSFVEVSEKSIMKEVQMVKVMRPNLQKFFYHTSINFPPAEDLSNATMIQIGHDYLRDSGFTQHQYIMFRHYDANHPHLHILVNRIGYDGKVLSDSNDFSRCEEILRRLEKKYNLAEVISSRQARERAVTKNEIEMIKRTHDPSVKIWLQATIKKTLEDNPGITTQEFIKLLEGKGINLQFNQASTGYVSGVSYGYNGFLITGSKLGNDFKWTTIRNKLDYKQERDRAAIHACQPKLQHRLETNLKTKAPRVYNEAGQAKRSSDIDCHHNFRSDHPLFETAKNFDLSRSDLSHRDNRDIDHQTNFDHEGFVTKRKRRKKRKSRRL